MTSENETIPVEKLSNEDLGKALSEAKQELEPIDEGEIETSDGDEAPIIKTTEVPSEPVLTIEDRIAKMEKRLADKEAFIAKQGDEIGKLRKLVPTEPKKELHDVNADNFFEDPVGNVEKISENARIKLELEQERRSNEFMEELLKRKEQTKQFVPDYETNIDLVAEVLKKDGFNEEGIKAFKQNPYAYDTPLLHNLNVRAKQDKRISELEAKIAELQGNPKRILDRVETITRQKPKVGNSAVNQESGEIDIERLTQKQIAKLTNEQLQTLLKKAKKK